jgi:hypothetical protein
MSKVVTMFLAAVLAAMGLILVPGVGSAQSATSNQNEGSTEGEIEQEAVAEATFEESLSVREVSRLAGQNDIEIAEVESELKVGSEEFQDGYVASPGQSAKEINKNYTKHRIGFLEAQIETAKSLPNDKLKQPKSQRYNRKLWIEDSLKNVVYLPFEQSNGSPALARRREGDTDAQHTPRR